MLRRPAGTLGFREDSWFGERPIRQLGPARSNPNCERSRCRSPRRLRRARRVRASFRSTPVLARPAAPRESPDRWRGRPRWDPRSRAWARRSVLAIPSQRSLRSRATVRLTAARSAARRRLPWPGYAGCDARPASLADATRPEQRLPAWGWVSAAALVAAWAARCEPCGFSAGPAVRAPLAKTSSSARSRARSRARPTRVPGPIPEGGCFVRSYTLQWAASGARDTCFSMSQIAERTAFSHDALDHTGDAERARTVDLLRDREAL